jgi:hypothetical protein
VATIVAVGIFRGANILAEVLKDRQAPNVLLPKP